jgi:hypothetical protein
MQQYLTQKELQKIGLSVQDSSLSSSDTVATVVHQIMTELSEAVSEKDKIMVITKIVLSETKCLLEYMAAQYHSV